MGTWPHSGPAPAKSLISASRGACSRLRRVRGDRGLPSTGERWKTLIRAKKRPGHCPGGAVVLPIGVGERVLNGLFDEHRDVRRQHLIGTRPQQ